MEPHDNLKVWRKIHGNTSGKTMKRKVDIGAEVRGRARQKIGNPPPSRRVLDKRRKPPKHKKEEWDDDGVCATY